MKKFCLIIGFLALMSSPLLAANENKQYIQIIKNDGGKIFGAEESKNNVKSSLRLEWYVLNDPTCPIQLIGAGVREYEQMGSYPLTYHYQANIQMQVMEPVAAYQVKFHLYNVFGQFLDELTVYEVHDLEAKEIYQQEEYFAHTTAKNQGALIKVIAYITNIRKPDGKVWSFSRVPVLNIVDELARSQ